MKKESQQIDNALEDKPCIRVPKLETLRRGGFGSGFPGRKLSSHVERNEVFNLKMLHMYFSNEEN